MNLNLFNNLEKHKERSEFVQTFTKELSEFLEKRDLKSHIQRKDISIIQDIQSKNKVTSSYRDNMNVERINILNSYAKETSTKGTMYYVYSKNIKDNTYNLCICKEGNSHEIIEVEENKLPRGAGVDSALREKNGSYILDEEGTEKIQIQMKEMINSLLKKQNEELAEKRIEGHIYEFVERGKDSIWLIDRTIYNKDNAEIIEEIDFPKELLENAHQGMMYKYINGSYCLV